MKTSPFITVLMTLACLVASAQEQSIDTTVDQYMHEASDAVCATNCNPRPRSCWDFSASALFLSREYNNAPVVEGDTPPPRPELIGSEAFDDDIAVGFELNARNDCWEIRYFQVDGFSDTVNPPVGSQYAGSTLNVPTALTYNTNLYSGEVNYFLTEPCATARLFTGFRYLKLEESLILDFPAGRLALLRTSAYNDLYGLQTGVDARLFTSRNGRLMVDGVAKGGAYLAHTRLHHESFLVAGGSVDDSEDELAFVGEAGVNLRYRICNWLSLDAGYQVLWLSGVSIASEQPQAINFVIPTVDNNHGEMYFHGGRVGLTATW